MTNRKVKLYSTLNDLNKKDTYSLILFTLFKLRNDPEYSTLSELSYVLDKDNLISLFTYFGGLTIKIPTLKDLRLILAALTLYQKVNINGESFNTVIKDVASEFTVGEIEEVYKKVIEVVKDYDFQREGEDQTKQNFDEMRESGEDY